MKHKLMLPILVLLYLHTSAQEFIVIDTNQSNIILSEHYDTLWNTQPYQYNVLLDIDTDGDSICDYSLKSDGYYGSGGYTEKLYFKSHGVMQGLNRYVVDTLVIDSIHNHDDGTYYVDTFSIAEKYSYGDNIYRSGPYTFSETYMINCFWQSPMLGPEVSMCIDDWQGGEHYIGIKTIHKGIEYLGWIRLSVNSGFYVVVKESVLYDPTFMIKQYQSPEILIYPNPAHDFIAFNNITFEELQIFNISGILTQTYILKPGSNRLSISILPAGIYTLIFIGNKSTAARKLIII